jgi:NitT/TauT family transport system substrate-binding protein
MTSINPVKRRKFLHYSSLVLASSLLAACTGNNKPTASTVSAIDNSTSRDRVSFGTNWYAQAEHGGFYQALATGIYQDYGLEVAIKMGGAQVNGTQLLMGGAVDFFMGSGADAIKAVEAGIPKITVAAIFQKDPQVLIFRPDLGVKTLADLKGKPIYVSAGANNTFWPLLKAKYGFTDEQKRPYNFSIAPFLVDKNSAQQGYLSSEPLKIKKQGGFEPVVLLLADYGYNPYSTTIETRTELVTKNSDLVQRFVEASIQGWYSYLQDPTPGNKLIKEANPEMTDEQLNYGLAKIKEFGIVLSGDAEKNGIGAMTDERWQTFFQEMVEAEIFKAETDYKKAYTLQFVNKRSVVSNQ